MLKVREPAFAPELCSALAVFSFGSTGSRLGGCEDKLDVFHHESEVGEVKERERLE